MSTIKLGMLLASAREEYPDPQEYMSGNYSDEGEDAREYVAVAVDDEGMPVFQGIMEYADGGYMGILKEDGEVVEWPLELVQMQD